MEIKAWESYLALQTILHEVGVIEALEKAVPLSTRMEFLGTTVDTMKLTLEILPHRLCEIKALLQKWDGRRYATKKQLQSLIGKLNFVTNCVHSGRIFLSRLIAVLTELPDNRTGLLPVDIRDDITWWQTFVHKFNGTSMLWLYDSMQIDQDLASDACLAAGGAVCNKEYFHFKFPDEILQETHHISQLELFTIVVMLKMWADQFKGKVVRLSSDNEASVHAVNAGRSKDGFMLKCLREIAFVTGSNDILLKLVHCPGSSNILPDLLSRWYSGAHFRR